MLEILLMFSASYAIFVAYVWHIQGDLLYFPSRYPSGYLPDHLRAEGVRVVELRTRDGIRLEGWWFPPASDSEPVLLCAHGNGGDIRYSGDEALHWNRQGFGVLLFDYRGYGASEEASPSEKGLYLDGEAAYSFLTDSERIAPGRIVLFGRSLGGGVASYLAEKCRAGALIIEASFTSVVDRGAEAYWYLPVRLIARDRFDSSKRAPAITIPVLIIHGTADVTIGKVHSERLAARFPTPPETYWIEGATHDDVRGVGGSVYFDRIESFVRRHAGR